MPGRILVLDPRPAPRAAVAAALAGAFFEAVEATTPALARALAADHRPDAAVVAATANGLQACRSLAQAHPACPLLVYDTAPEAPARLAAFEAGATDCLSRPLDARALCARLHSLTRTKTTLDQLDDTIAALRVIGLGPEPLPSTHAHHGAVILLVCGESALETALARTLHDHLGATVELAEDAADALAYLKTHRVNAIVLGPGPSPDSIARLATALAAHPKTREAGLILLAPPDAHSLAQNALQAGLPDALTLDPADPAGGLAEVAARLRVQLQRRARLERLHREIRHGLDLALTDPLTGLSNRRYADARTAALAATGKPLAAMVLDLDEFKHVNDHYGHSAGDKVLVEFARRLRLNVRAGDVVARIGGEEFLVLMPEIRTDAAARVAERVRHAVETPRFAIDDQGGEIALTVSIGLALHDGNTTRDAASVTARAGQALLLSKRAGRNTVTVLAA
ncbi:MAG: diguanylate cyclase [Pseudomonadota bacterium]